MEPSLLRKCQDNARRAEKLAIQTNSEFLTPAEQISLQDPSISPIFFGGDGDCERKMAFFLPSWLEEIHPEEAISAISIVPSFGTPGHRDYLGSVLSLGIRRECIGDLRITPEGAYLFCQKNLADYLILNLSHVGGCGVKCRELSLSQMPPLHREYRAVSFTVQSPRLDAVCAGMFRLSRSAAATQITAGNVQVNYVVCLRSDSPMHPGDIVTLRGYGKGTLCDFGGTSRKGRTFLEAKIWK